MNEGVKLHSTSNYPFVGSGIGIPGPNEEDAELVKEPFVGSGIGIPGPKLGLAKAAEAEAARRVMATKRITFFMGVYLLLSELNGGYAKLCQE